MLIPASAGKCRCRRLTRGVASGRPMAGGTSDSILSADGIFALRHGPFTHALRRDLRSRFELQSALSYPCVALLHAITSVYYSITRAAFAAPPCRAAKPFMIVPSGATAAGSHTSHGHEPPCRLRVSGWFGSGPYNVSGAFRIFENVSGRRLMAMVWSPTAWHFELHAVA